MAIQLLKDFETLSRNRDCLTRLPWKMRRPGEPIIVLTGAGVSKASGLPDGRALTRVTMRALTRRWLPRGVSPNRIAKIVPLETVFQALVDNGGEILAQRVIQLLDSTNPSPTHHLVNSLVKRGLISKIYTFNFDSLHEQGFAESSTVPQNFSGRTVFRHLEWGGGEKLEVIKLHGSSNATGTITLAEYLKGISNEAGKRFHADFKGKCWLVLGYGGWDLDFQQLLFNALRRRSMPRELIWVDKNFPAHGGRSDLLALLDSAGVPVMKAEFDLTEFCNHLAGRKFKSTCSKWNPKPCFDLLSTVKDEQAASITLELSLHVGDSKYVGVILKAAKVVLKSPQALSYYRARLLEQSPKPETSLRFYRDAAKGSSRTEQRLVSAIRAFAVSKGASDLFQSTRLSTCPAKVRALFRFISKARKTDLGGLDRRLALRWCQKAELTIRGAEFESIGWMRFCISALSEIARLFHEAGEYKEALRVDLKALRIAESLVDPFYLAIVLGNVGACYMGLADSAKSTSATELLRQAEVYLTRATQVPALLNKFSYGLHFSNLGVVQARLGHADAAVRNLRLGLNVLEKAYPNYAVCFWGELARVHAEAALAPSEHYRRRRQTLMAIRALTRGCHLAKRLSDWDDKHFLEAGLVALQKVPNVSKAEMVKIERRLGNNA